MHLSIIQYSHHFTPFMISIPMYYITNPQMDDLASCLFPLYCGETMLFPVRRPPPYQDGKGPKGPPKGKGKGAEAAKGKGCLGSLVRLCV